MQISSNRVAYLFLFIAMLSWSGNLTLGRALDGLIPPFSITFWRWCIATVIMTPFFFHYAWQQRQLIWANGWLVITLILVGFVGNQSAIYLALTSTTSINVALMMSTAPLIIPVLSFLFHREVIRKAQIVGILLSLIGVAIIILRGEMNGLQALTFVTGDLWALLAVLLWSVYSVALQWKPAELDARGMLWLSALVASIILYTPYHIEAKTVGHFLWGWKEIISLLYIAIFPSILAFLCYNMAVHKIGANRTGPFMHLMPFLSTILAIVFLSETLEMFQIAGVLFIFSGIYVTSVKSMTGGERSAE